MLLICLIAFLVDVVVKHGSESSVAGPFSLIDVCVAMAFFVLEKPLAGPVIRSQDEFFDVHSPKGMDSSAILVQHEWIHIGATKVMSAHQSSISLFINAHSMVHAFAEAILADKPHINNDNVCIRV